MHAPLYRPGRPLPLSPLPAAPPSPSPSSAENCCSRLCRALMACGWALVRGGQAGSAAGERSSSSRTQRQRAEQEDSRTAGEQHAACSLASCLASFRRSFSRCSFSASSQPLCAAARERREHKGQPRGLPDAKACAVPRQHRPTAASHICSNEAGAHPSRRSRPRMRLADSASSMRRTMREAAMAGPSTLMTPASAANRAASVWNSAAPPADCSGSGAASDCSCPRLPLPDAAAAAAGRRREEGCKKARRVVGRVKAR